MKYTLKIFSLLLCVFASLAIAGDSWAETCSSNNCHPRIGAEGIAHAPVQSGECAACHSQQRESHPSGQGPDFALAATGAELCFGCHARDAFDFTNPHGPVSHGACTICHLPHGSKLGKLLRMPVKDLCFFCHSDFAHSIANAPIVHSAIRERDCSACHSSHGSNFPNLLRGDSTELCFECHTDIRDKYKHSLKKHEPLYVQDKCGNCHSAHFSNHSALLIMESRDLCYSCHGQTDTSRSDALRNIKKEVEGKKYVHAPLAEGNCSGCHDTHGSSYPLLLRGSYPGGFYAPYKADSYGLCFECHERELLVDQATDSATGFRNGKLNLHYLHVGITEKGRTCRACHSIHASDGEKLINPDGILFGKWKVPVKFKGSENGGSCIPGCHRPMAYDRKEPVDNTLKEEAPPDNDTEIDLDLDAGGDQPAPGTKNNKARAK